MTFNNGNARNGNAMKIAYVTSYDALNLHNWSGLGHYISQALIANQCEIDYIGNLNRPNNNWLKLKRRVYSQFNKRFEFEREPFFLKSYAKQVQERLKPENEVVFSPGTLPLAYLKTKLPKVIYTDATFAGMLNFYEVFSNLSKETIRHGHDVEQRALENASLVIYSSEWAAKSAIEYYNISQNKIRVVPFGANFTSSLALNEIEALIHNRLKSDVFNLLFVGVDWKRKGGDKVLAIGEILKRRGLNIRLHVVGINDNLSSLFPEWVINHGFISKATPEGLRRIRMVFESAHMFILPTEADCTPVVFSEANSFGVPCVSTNVGGLKTIIQEGVNGKTFDLNADVEEYADYIQKVLIDKEIYLKLALSSYNEYVTRLNWSVSGKTIVNLLNSVVNR